MSPEWAPGVSDPEPQELLLAPIDLHAPPVEESRRKPLQSRALLELKLAGKQVPVLTPVPNPVLGASQMAVPPILARRAGGVCGAPQGDFPPSR